MGYRTILLDPAHLHQARAVLEAEGYEVHTPPPELLEAGVLLTAYRAADGEGYLLSAEEVRLLAMHNTLAVLDPDHPDPRPRWERPTTRDRERAYAEAALANAVLGVQSAPPGNRNNVLAKVAFGLGQLEHLGLDRVRVLEALEEAALSTGLPLLEARTTARRGFERGSRQPRDLPPDLVQSAKGCARGFALNRRDNEGLSPHLLQNAKHRSVFARKGGKR